MHHGEEAAQKKNTRNKEVNNREDESKSDLCAFQTTHACQEYCYLGALPQKTDLLSFRPGFSPVTRLALKSRRTVLTVSSSSDPLEKPLS